MNRTWFGLLRAAVHRSACRSAPADLRRRALGVVVAFCLGVVLLACGDDDLDSADGTDETTAPTTTSTASTGGSTSTTPTQTMPSSSSSTVTTASSASDDDDGDDFDWGDWGPDDPPIPDQYAAIAVASSGALDCRRLEDNAPDGDFWELAIGICLAVRDGADWPAVDAVPNPQPADNPYQACMNEELRAVLDGALAWHQSHPGERPTVSYADNGSRSPCQTTIYTATATVAPDDLDGHPEGGVVIGLAIPGLPNSGGRPDVLVDGAQVTYVHGGFSGAGDGLANGEVFLPAPVQAHEALVEIRLPVIVLTTTVDLPSVDPRPIDTTTTTTTDPADVDTGPIDVSTTTTSTLPPTTTAASSDDDPAITESAAYVLAHDRPGQIVS
jgi:hypothetical protein